MKTKITLAFSESGITYETETDEKPVQTIIKEKNREVIQESYQELTRRSCEFIEILTILFSGENNEDKSSTLGN